MDDPKKSWIPVTRPCSIEANGFFGAARAMYRKSFLQDRICREGYEFQGKLTSKHPKLASQAVSFGSFSSVSCSHLSNVKATLLRFEGQLCREPNFSLLETHNKPGEVEQGSNTR